MDLTTKFTQGGGGYREAVHSFEYGYRPGAPGRVREERLDPVLMSGEPAELGSPFFVDRLSPRH